MSKVCIVTGASRGIGRGTAIALGEKGASVVINYNKNKAAAEETARAVMEKGGRAKIFCGDISDENTAKALADFTVEKFGRIDALVNNAGIALPPLPFDMTKKEDWDKVFGVNIYGVLNCTKAVLPHMIHNKSGSVVNVSSVWGITGGSCEVVYSTSKAAITGFTKSLAKEVAPSGIRVNAVAPGIINTDMNSHLGENEIKDIEKEIPLGRMGKPEEIASLIAFLCLEESKYITGEIIKTDGGWC